MNQSIISAKHIKKSYGQTHALRGVSLDVLPGEVLAIMVQAALASRRYFIAWRQSSVWIAVKLCLIENALIN